MTLHTPTIFLWNMFVWVSIDNMRINLHCVSLVSAITWHNNDQMYQRSMKERNELLSHVCLIDTHIICLADFRTISSSSGYISISNLSEWVRHNEWQWFSRSLYSSIEEFVHWEMQLENQLLRRLKCITFPKWWLLTWRLSWSVSRHRWLCKIARFCRRYRDIISNFCFKSACRTAVHYYPILVKLCI